MKRIVILAAGKGTRMGSNIPKVLTPLAGRPMIEYLIRSIKEADPATRPVVVISPTNGEAIKLALSSYACDYAIQTEQLGTGHALASALGLMGDEVESVVSFYGDHPFVQADTVRKLISCPKGIVAMATIKVQDFLDYRKNFYSWGRIIREGDEVKRIVEFKDAIGEEKEIMEVNPGFYCFNRSWLKENINKLKNENSQKEYYLTDLIGLAVEQKHKINAIAIDPRQAIGINSPEELAVAENLIKQTTEQKVA